MPGDSIAFGKILLYLLFGKADLLLLVGFFLAHHGKDDIRIKSALTGKRSPVSTVSAKAKRRG